DDAAIALSSALDGSDYLVGGPHHLRLVGCQLSEWPARSRPSQIPLTATSTIALRGSAGCSLHQMASPARAARVSSARGSTIDSGTAKSLSALISAATADRA